MRVRELVPLVVLPLFVACSLRVTDSSEDFAASELGGIAACIERFSFDDCSRLQTLSEYLDLAVQRKLVLRTKRDKQEQDWWGNPYHFEHVKSNESITLRITSNGLNGVFENGKGDDICCEITIPKNGSPAHDFLRGGKVIRIRK